MHKVSLAFAVLGSAFSAFAQNCNGSPPASTFATRDPFASSFYYGNTTSDSYNLYFDAVLQSPVTITSMRVSSYDQGVGNPVVPNQVGATSVVNVYSIPNTRSGNEGSATGWTMLGTGTITVAAWPAESPIAFAVPVPVSAGTFGFAIEVLPTTTGPAPGGLHCMGVSPAPGLPVSDSFWTVTNEGIQQTAWTAVTPLGTNIAGINLKMSYTPAASAALWTTLGAGCYFRPQAFYEDFPPSATAPDLANTSLSLINLGPNYIVLPGGVSYITPTSANLTLVQPGSSSSGALNTPAAWDDGLTVPILLPFTFAYPSGSTNEITISSNATILLANVINNAYSVCGACYGSIAPFKDGPPRISPFHTDLDPSPTGGGSMHYDVDPLNQFVRVTWAAIPEWTPPGPGPLNTMQVTMWSNGNIDIFYGTLGNSGAGASGNNAVTGFTQGLGASLPPAMDISAALPFTTGDGSIPPILGMDARPVLGTAPNIVTSNITPGTFFEIFVASLGGIAPPVDLSIYGMPGCNLHLNQGLIVSAFLTGITGNNTFVVPFAIPIHPSFQNVQFFFQAAPLTGGLNPAGLLTSNGICAKLGT